MEGLEPFEGIMELYDPWHLGGVVLMIPVIEQTVKDVRHVTAAPAAKANNFPGSLAYVDRVNDSDSG
jgi:hypothetical protein